MNEKDILSFCESPKQLSDIAAHLDATEDETLTLAESLVRQAKLQRVKRSRYRAVRGNALVGTYRSKHGYSGGGYVIPNDRNVPTVTIPEGFSDSSVDGDRVLVQYKQASSRRGGRNELTGRVLSIVDKRPTEAVGVFELGPKRRPNVMFRDARLPRFAVLERDDADDLREGEIIRVKLFRNTDRTGRSRAEVLEVVGNLDDPAHDLDNLCALYGFDPKFSEAATEQANALPDNPDASEFNGRIDFRGLLTIAIDPKDAKDHDDAITFETLEDGLVRLGVHIADVAHYVRRGEPLDADAQARATSVYLPGRLIPMLPFELSAGLCSLKQGVDRLALSCLMTFNRKGEIVQREIVESVVRVDHFLSYEQALPILHDTNDQNPLHRTLRDARKLADTLQANRYARGALSLNIPRAHVIVDAQGEVESVEADVQDEAHNLIEEFMLAANGAVAEFLIDRGLPYIGRIHPEPPNDAQDDFAEYCVELGLRSPDLEDARDLAKFLVEVEARKDYEAIHYAVLRSMSRAAYSDVASLHYALQTTKYVHFTSPIRRYPDVLVHRAVKAYLALGQPARWVASGVLHPWLAGDKDKPNTAADGKDIDIYQTMMAEMPQLASQCTDQAIKADQAEIAANQIKLLRQYMGRVGEPVKGRVIVIAGKHLVLRLDDSFAEGQIEYGMLTRGWVEQHKYWVRFETHTGMLRVLPGDTFEAEIGAVDLASRSLQLIPVALLNDNGRYDFRPKSQSRGKKRTSRESKKPRQSSRGGKGQSKKSKRKGGRRR